MPNRKKNTGKAFEDVVSWIHSAMHKTAAITPNDHLEDKITGEMRQIDITIRMSDGFTSVLVIVEVRDHVRRVGTGYVEEVQSKRSSVGADAAVIVSSSGFTGPAKKKARHFSIRTMTLKEAREDSWSEFFTMRTFGVHERKYDRCVLSFFSHGQAIEPDPEHLRSARKNPDFPFFSKADGAPLQKTLSDMGAALFRALGEEPFAGIPKDGTKVSRQLGFPVQFDEPLAIRDSEGVLRTPDFVVIQTELWWEVREWPIRILCLKSETDGRLINEVAVADTVEGGRHYRYMFMPESPGSTEGSRIVIRWTEVGGSTS